MPHPLDPGGCPDPLPQSSIKEIPSTISSHSTLLSHTPLSPFVISYTFIWLLSCHVHPHLACELRKAGDGPRACQRLDRCSWYAHVSGMDGEWVLISGFPWPPHLPQKLIWQLTGTSLHFRLFSEEGLAFHREKPVIFLGVVESSHKTLCMLIHCDFTWNVN